MGEVETLAIGNGGSICCVAYIPVYSAVCCLNCTNLRAVYVLSDYQASCTFALSFLICLGGAASGSRGGVTNTRLGVEAAIGALGLCLVGRRGCLVAGTS